MSRIRCSKHGKPAQHAILGMVLQAVLEAIREAYENVSLEDRNGETRGT